MASESMQRKAWMAAAAVMGAGLLAGAPAARAAEEAPPAGQAQGGREQRGGLMVSVEPFVNHVFESDFDDIAGQMSVTRGGVGALLVLPTSETFSLTLVTRAEYSRYDLGGLVAPLSDDLLEDALSVTAIPGVDVRLSETWSIAAAPILTYSAQTNVDISDAMTYGALVSARYKVSDKLALSFGLAAATRLEDDPRVIPILGIDWQIREGLTLATEGPGLRLEQRLPAGFSIALGVAYESRQYRLRENNVVPEGVLSDERVPVLLELGWRPTEQVTLRLGAGVMVYQNVEVDNQDGDEVAESKADPAPFIGAAATVRF